MSMEDVAAALMMHSKDERIKQLEQALWDIGMARYLDSAHVLAHEALNGLDAARKGK